ncbi:MAG: TAT-variant-translocated molybdopterin oxidoreductase [Caldilineaceae bacterium]|nr:TAT-variant-translocated molybdopterin oxidoreductase [Caldilineaceae bacterium]
MDKDELSIGEIRARLAQPHTSKQFWRSLEEVANTEAFQKLLEAEFPRQIAASMVSEARSGTTRRDFLKLMGAALAMAGLTGCTPEKPGETIVPYVVAPEEIVPGKPLFYATAIQLGGYAIGVLAENHLGRPTKLEGNPQHAASLGGTNALIQGSLLTLYDPDRAQVVTRQGQINTWENFLAELNPRLDALEANGGAGLHLLTGRTTSPTLGSQIAALRERFPQATWHQYEPVSNDNLYAGTQLAFGEPALPVYHFEAAQRIVSLDADFLFTQPGSVRYARDFIDQRRVWNQPEMNRLYMLESTPTITGAKADHRLAVQASQVELFARSLARTIGVAFEVEIPQNLADEQARWVEAAARDLIDNAGASLVIAGETQPAVVHALAHAINESLGNVGNTVSYIAPVEVEAVTELESLRTLTEAMTAGDVDTLVIIDCNPVLTAPVDFAFAEAMGQVEFCAQMSFYLDETSEFCHWHIPGVHELESWSDARSYDGTATIIQPLIAPLFQGRSAHEMLAALVGGETRSPYEIVRSYWHGYYAELDSPPQEDVELFWRTALHDGIVAGSASAPLDLRIQATALPAPTVGSGELELNFRPDPTVWDGRFTNNLWLQELPKQLTLLTWDNALLLSPATAERLGIASHDRVQVTFRERVLEAAAWIMPGHADESATIHLGYGRSWEGKASEELGFNAYALRTSDAFWFGSGASIQSSGGRYPLASIQEHDSLAGRDLVRAGTLAHFQEDPNFARGGHGPAEGGTGTGVEAQAGSSPSLYPEYEYEGNAWGMSIDLNACIGCNACTIACQIENNIPIVGKEGVLNGREMHWIKVDRYYAGELDDPETHFQPRPCMHCEKAPCEPVCPVAATVHDSEGLNEMVYNRCVGTRYCSNNCPYKVRRFNFYEYNEDEIPLMAMWRNPDVTVRSRGVMEKCSYCIQRINQGRIDAEKENRPIRDGEVLTACQQACPTQAIVFGNINDTGSVVAQQKQSPLHYGMLEELGTQPRTTYLAAVRNPNPELET